MFQQVIGEKLAEKIFKQKLEDREAVGIADI